MKELTVFICTDPETRKQVAQYLDKDTMPYISIMPSHVTYAELVMKIEELEA